MPSSNTSDWDRCIRTSSSECSNGPLKGGSEWEWASEYSFLPGLQCNTHTATHDPAPKKYYTQLTVFGFPCQTWHWSVFCCVTCASHAQHNTWWNLPAPDNHRRCGGSHGGKAWLHRSRFSHWAVRGRVDVCSEGESYQICTPLARLQLTAVFERVTSCAARCTRAALSCYRANDVCQMLSVCDSFHVTKLNWCEYYHC